MKLRQVQKYPFLPNLRVLNWDFKSVLLITSSLFRYALCAFCPYTVHNGVYEFRVNSKILFFSYYAQNVSDSITLYIYIYIYIYIYKVIYQDGFWQLRQQVSIHILTVIGRGCLAGGAGGWCPSTIVLHIFWGCKYLYYNIQMHIEFYFVIFSDSPMASSTSKCRECLNKANSFCYVCGDFTTVAQRRTMTSLLRTTYFPYFDCKIGDQDKSWAPHICCKPCYNGLTAWFNGKKAAFNFAVPMVWRELPNHADDCFFLLI